MGLNILRAPKPCDISKGADDFLRDLGVSTIIELPGRDRSRNRTFVTLSHGNEPSGFQALHKWLREGRSPAVDITVVLAGVEAALKEPIFFHRHLPDQRDFNRCFCPPYEDPQGLKAKEVLERILWDCPEAVIDMHNTSGATPPFAVSCKGGIGERALARIFVDRLIVSDLRMGALMEGKFSCPVVTVEVGGSGDAGSLDTAIEGLERFFLWEDLFTNDRTVPLVTNPLRLELKNIGLGYADGSSEDHEIILRNDIESLNFRPLDRNEYIGWIDEQKLSCLRVRKKNGLCDINKYFTIRQGRIYPKGSMVLFMATKRADIAVSDCLFYFVCADD